jgi:hypothetical protein
MAVLEVKGLGFDMDELIRTSTKSKTFPIGISESATEYYLKPEHKFYTQVQGQMGVVGVSRCLFIACTGDEGQSQISIWVPFNSTFFENILNKVRLVNSALENTDLLVKIGEKYN